MLDKIIGYLDLPDSDYWYDEGCIIARRIIDEGSDSILRILACEWRSWPEARQEHLAYILGDSSSESEVSLIKDMLHSDSELVSFRAREALNNLGSKT